MWNPKTDVNIKLF